MSTDECPDLTTRVVHLGSQFDGSLIGLPGEAPLLSWRVLSSGGATVQAAYQLQWSAEPTFRAAVHTEEIVASDQAWEVPAPGGPLASRETRFYRVRVLTDFGWTEYSPALRYEAGLLCESDIAACAIGDDTPAHGPATLLRKEFQATRTIAAARLYVTAQGVCDLYINGRPVAEEFLNPGWTPYAARLLMATYDVSKLLRRGSNVISSELADGWFRGRLGFMGASKLYGEHTSLLAQLEIEFADGTRETVVTDSTWRTATGEVQMADLYDGCTIDQRLEPAGWQLPGFDDGDWAPAIHRPLALRTLQPRIAPPVRTVSEFELVLEPQRGRTLLVGTQNISGWVRLVVDGRAGQTIVVRHAEVLEEDRCLHTRALRSAAATDTYILGRDGRQTLEPRFTFHGFQYADVVTDADIVSATAVAISSDLAPRSTFSCSDTRLNSLHSNVVWSQLDNFVSIPTDCPQRDERLGWTGDAQAFAPTANTLFDTQMFWTTWLADLSLEQHANGDVSAIVPDVMDATNPFQDGWPMEGRAGWADAAVIIPMSIHESFGSVEILQRQRASIRRWLGALETRRAGNALLPTEFQFGDWCDPDAPGDKPWLSKVSPDFVANAFFAHSAQLASRMESLLGNASEAARFERMSTELKAIVWTTFGEAARTTPAGCALALEFEICPQSERQAVADELAAMIRTDGGRISTGFLGTPHVLHALSKNGHIEEAYLTLMRRGIRSWLYQVDRGATTMWERWDAIDEDGSIHSGAGTHDSDAEKSMISFNHYSYGAVIDWVYRNVAGLAPVMERPGYRITRVAPRPTNTLSFARASIDSRLGSVAIDWSLTTDGDLHIDLDIPFGGAALLDLPVTVESDIWVNGVRHDNGEQLAAGHHSITIVRPRIVTYA